MRRSSITLTLKDRCQKEALEAIALSLNCCWGHKPNISEMLQEIANGDLKVVPSDPTKAEVERCKQLQALMNIRSIAVSALEVE